LVIEMERRQLCWQRGIQVSQWKRQLLDGASELFTRGKNSKDPGESQVKEAELFQQIGRLQMAARWVDAPSRYPEAQAPWQGR